MQKEALKWAKHYKDEFPAIADLIILLKYPGNYFEVPKETFEPEYDYDTEAPPECNNQ